MINQAAITPEQLHFAVFCIESLADSFGVGGDIAYKMLADDTDVLDSYILPCYDALHTQGKDYIVEDLKELLRRKGSPV